VQRQLAPQNHLGNASGTGTITSPETFNQPFIRGLSRRKHDTVKSGKFPDHNSTAAAFGDFLIT
jgi:hypothetical protein